MRLNRALVLGVCTVCPSFVLAYGTGDVAPLTTFGTNGYLAPGTTYNTINNTERGLAYGNGHVYLVSRAGGNNIRILDPNSGADLGGLNTTGISGGTFAENTIAVGTDGAIYVNNLTTNSSTTAYTIYKYATESSAPVVVYSGNAANGARVGDSLAAFGGGSSTVLASGFSGASGYAITNPTGMTSTAVAVAGTSNGDFRLGITFAGSANTVFGSQNGGQYQDTTYSGSTGTLVSTVSLATAYSGSGGERLLAYSVVGGTPLLAVVSPGDSHVSVYDVTNPTSPVDVGYGYNIPSGTTVTTNGNATGQVAWGPTVGNTATLYTLSTNQGIEAYMVTVPEPASFCAIGLGALATLRRRRA